MKHVQGVYIIRCLLKLLLLSDLRGDEMVHSEVIRTAYSWWIACVDVATLPNTMGSWGYPKGIGRAYVRACRCLWRLGQIWAEGEGSKWRSRIGCLCSWRLLVDWIQDTFIFQWTLRMDVFFALQGRIDRIGWSIHWCSWWQGEFSEMIELLSVDVQLEEHVFHLCIQCCLIPVVLSNKNQY